MPEVHWHGGQYYVDPLVAKRLNDAYEIVFVVIINTCHARVIVRDALVSKHLHAFPLEILLRIGRSDLQNEAVQGLPDPCAP